jgi:hypothetical protein
MYPQARPLGKPNPFSYIAALYGNNRDKYESYININTSSLFTMLSCLLI